MCWAGPQPLRLSQTAVANIVYGDKTWSPRAFNPAAELARIDASDQGAMKSNDPNLAPFFNRGGKLLMWHGWADPQVPPQLSTIYYSNVLKTVGPSARSVDRAVHDAGRLSLRRRSRTRQLRPHGRHRRLGRARPQARASHGVALEHRRRGPHAAPVSVSAGGGLLRQGQHQRRRELLVPGARGAACIHRARVRKEGSAAALLGAGLVDEVGLNIHPLLLGQGVPGVPRSQASSALQKTKGQRALLSVP